MPHRVLAEFLGHTRQLLAQADQLVAQLSVKGITAAAIAHFPFDLAHVFLQARLDANQQVGVVLKHLNATAHRPKQLQG